MTKRVLVVDDEPAIVRFLQVHLERAGFDVFGAGNGQEALERLAQEPSIDLIITDIMMPVMDGFELLSKVRQQPTFASIPIIMLGALRNEVSADDPPGMTMEDLRQEARQFAIAKYGVCDYFGKPFHPAALVQAVEATLAGT